MAPFAAEGLDQYTVSLGICHWAFVIGQGKQTIVKGQAIATLPLEPQRSQSTQR
jgi:hypothetical protein